MREFLPFFLLLIALAVVLRDDSVVALFYLLVGVFVAGRWWSQRALRAVTFERVYPDHVFLGENLAVTLRVHNAGLLPVVWLQLRESVPPDLAGRRNLQEVVTLGPRGRAEITYDLQPHKRGYYELGPLAVSSGDLLGLGADERQGLAGALTVYPKIVPLRQLSLPSRSPLGTLRDTRPLFADPARVVGRRDYAPGDSLRRVDWKSTAAVGRLQVKQFEPSIALHTVLVLGFSHADYDPRSRYDASELAVVIAASLASWVAGRRQTLGLLTNGLDPLRGAPAEADGPMVQRGARSLMSVLETLARVELAEAAPPAADVLRRAGVRLPWGTTVVVITGRADEVLLDALVQARRAGLQAVLILAGPATNAAEWRARAARVGVAVHALARERDLDEWRL